LNEYFTHRSLETLPTGQYVELALKVAQTHYTNLNRVQGVRGINKLIVTYPMKRIVEASRNE